MLKSFRQRAAARGLALVVATLMAVSAVDIPQTQARSPLAPPASQPALAGAAQADAMVSDWSARRRVRRHRNNAAAAAMFGLVAGTIATVAAQERYRRYHAPYGYYDDDGYAPAPGYVYEDGGPYYGGGPVYVAPRYVAPRRVYRGRVYRGRVHAARPHVVRARAVAAKRAGRRH